MFCSVGKCSGDLLITPRTVAELIASVASEIAGNGQVVICAGKDINKKIRPAIAGLKILLPNPPNDTLITPIANKHPKARIHNGRFDGTLKAKRTPVMIAEPSKAVGVFLIMYLTIKYSNKTQKTTADSVIINASNLNTYSATKNAGISA